MVSINAVDWRERKIQNKTIYLDETKLPTETGSFWDRVLVYRPHVLEYTVKERAQT